MSAALLLRNAARECAQRTCALLLATNPPAHIVRIVTAACVRDPIFALVLQDLLVQDGAVDAMSTLAPTEEVLNETVGAAKEATPVKTQVDNKYDTDDELDDLFNNLP